jgi:hypothetical protein
VIIGALAMRVLVDVDRAHVYRWLGGAGAAFLAATILWALFLVRSLLKSSA